MKEKTLGQVAYEKRFGDASAGGWDCVNRRVREAWEEAAQAVIAAAEARKWRPIAEAPKEGWFWLNTIAFGTRLARRIDDPKYDFEFFEPNYAGQARFHMNAIPSVDATAYAELLAAPEAANA